jgi:hypothetical protein
MSINMPRSSDFLRLLLEQADIDIDLLRLHTAVVLKLRLRRRDRCPQRTHGTIVSLVVVEIEALEGFELGLGELSEVFRFKWDGGGDAGGQELW